MRSRRGRWRAFGCGSGLKVLGDVAANVEVGRRVAGLGAARRTGVVDVVRGLLQGIKHHLLVGSVRVQRGDDALSRVVEQYGADADADIELEAVGIGEEGLVLADRPALVVEDGPAAADPAGIGVCRRHHRLAVGADDHSAICIALRRRPGLGLIFLLELAAEAIRAGKAELDLQALRRLRCADMGFARQRGGTA